MNKILPLYNTMDLVSDGLVLNFDNVNAEQFQNTRELEAMNLPDLLDSNEIQLDNFLPEQESSNVQSDMINSSQRDSEENELVLQQTKTPCALTRSIFFKAAAPDGKTKILVRQKVHLLECFFYHLL